MNLNEVEVIYYKHRTNKMLHKYDRMLYNTCPNCGSLFYQYIPYKSYFLMVYECETYIEYNFEYSKYNEKIVKTDFCKVEAIKTKKKSGHP